MLVQCLWGNCQVGFDACLEKVFCAIPHEERPTHIVCYAIHRGFSGRAMERRHREGKGHSPQLRRWLRRHCWRHVRNGEHVRPQWLRGGGEGRGRRPAAQRQACHDELRRHTGHDRGHGGAQVNGCTNGAGEGPLSGEQGAGGVVPPVGPWMRLRLAAAAGAGPARNFAVCYVVCEALNAYLMSWWGRGRGGRVVCAGRGACVHARALVYA